MEIFTVPHGKIMYNGSPASVQDSFLVLEV